MMPKTKQLLYTLSLAGLLSVSVPVSGLAASACKGLTNNQCGKGCIWVDSYTTKAGNKVKGYCRTKPGASSASKDVKKTKEKSTEKATKLKEKTTKSAKDKQQNPKKATQQVKDKAKKSQEKATKKVKEKVKEKTKASK